MKKIIRTIALLAGISLPIAGSAQILSDNFESYPLATNWPTYNYASTPGTATIVSPGAASAQALELSFTMVSGQNINAGTQWAATPSGNTDPVLADYTLSYDFAISQGTNTGLGSVLVSVFGSGSANGSEATVPVGSVTVGGGFQHFSINMALMTPGYSMPVLNPTSAGPWTLQFAEVNYGNSTSGFEVMQLDNVVITLVPEPSTFAMLLGGLGLFAGWRRYRRA